MMRHIKGNWGAKLLSLLAAIFMWFFIMRDQNPVLEVSYTVPVQIQNLNKQYIMDGVPTKVRVTLSGPRDKIININHDTLKAYVDASQVSPGQVNVPIQFTPPTGTSIVSIDPDSITVNVDEYAEKQVKVEIQPVGKLSNTVAVRNVTVSPETVSITGRKHDVDSVVRVIMKVNFTGQTQNFATGGTLEAVDAAGHIVDVTIYPAQGQAQYEIISLRKEKTVPVVVPLVGPVADGYEVTSVTTNPEKVTITGMEETIDNISEINTKPVTVEGRYHTEEGVYDLALPEGVTANTNTVGVQVKITKK